MNLKRMRYFVAVAEDLHFGRAAARLNVVQPAISQQIRLLEQDLDVHLFERSSRKVSLTPAGKAYLTEAKRALLQVELATQVARDAATGLVGSLAIGFVDNAIWSPFPKVVREFRKRYPRIDLTLTQMPRSHQLAALQNSQLDIAVIPGPLARRNIIVEELARTPLYVVVPKDHPLGAAGEIDIAQLEHEPFVALPAVEDPKRINEIINALCADAGFVPILGQGVQQMHTALSLISTGLGVSIVPHWICAAWTENVEYRRLVPHFDYELVMATDERRQRNLVARFKAIARQICRTSATSVAEPSDGSSTIPVAAANRDETGQPTDHRI